MKNLLLYIVAFFVSSLLSSQEKLIQLDWANNQSINQDGVYTEVPLANNAGVNVDNSGRFQFLTTWKSEGFSYDAAIVSNVVYADIEIAKLININKDQIPVDFEISIKQSFARGVTYDNLMFSPFVNKSGVYKKIISFVIKGAAVSAIKSSNRSQKSLKVNEVLSSVLVSGNWYKFKVEDTGVYKITPGFLSSIGVDLNGVDANTIRIFGNGGQALPLSNKNSVTLDADGDPVLDNEGNFIPSTENNPIFDIPENPIKIIGGEDGVFSGDDYILFYGRGTEGFVEENKSHINPYDENAYYYVTYGDEISKKITEMTEPTEVPVQVFDSYDYYDFYEKDLFNLGQLGRVWHGDKFDGFEASRDYEFVFPELKLDSEVNVGVVFSAIYGSSPQLSMELSDSSGIKDVSSVAITGLNTSNNAYSGVTLSSELDSSVLNNDLTVNLNYQIGADASSEGFLDYITFSAECNLNGFGEQFSFSNNETTLLTGIGQFQISNANDLSAIWDITDPYNITEKSNLSNSLIEVAFNLGDLRIFAALDANDFYEPISVSDSEIANQDLKNEVFQNGSGQFEDVDYLILTTNEFISVASELADFRTLNDGFNVKVVDVELIYTEFSTGKQDVAAIRNFIKYVYDNASNDDARLKYVCIIGDGSYDYKDRIGNKVDHVPLYHALESSSLPRSYTTDDFYCFMDVEEGANPASDKMDLSIGRIIARNSAEASVMVDKIKSYYSEEAYGDWRNSMLFLSDDVDVASDGAIQEKIVEISNKLEEEVERVNVKRILTDSYVQQTTSGGGRYEEAKKDFEDAFELGVSYINYFGHGGEDGITGEFVFTTESAQNLTNGQRLPVFVTLTCELTRFDNPNRVTAGEFLYWNPLGGAVALISTTRNLFLTTGLSLNDSLSDALFDEDNLTISIGDAVRLSKNSLSGDNKRTVFCIGDPALKIALPKPEVELTEVDGLSLNDWVLSGDSLQALGRVNLKGKVVDGVGGRDLDSYNGQVTISVFDKIVERETLVNDGVGAPINFTESGSLIFKGLVSVVNGEFSSEFVLPKTVRLEEGEGRVNFYAQNSQILDDQAGAKKIIIGGLNVNAVEDVTPPLVSLYLNDETFSSGQVVSASPSIFAKLSDENGINTAGGVGHDIIAILDGDESNPIILNEYYNTNLDDFTSGELVYKLSELDPGEHTLSLRVSDTYNNSSVDEILFLVNESGDFSLSKILNYPNPFVSYTEFRFANNASLSDVLEVSVQVMTVTGKIITTKFATLSAKDTYNGLITWDGKDDFGNKIGKGVYVYKITAKSTLTNKTTSKFQKLVVL